jgi:polar amino acid transport system substrate-binding protein
MLRIFTFFTLCLFTTIGFSRDFVIVGEPGPLWKYEENGKVSGIDVDIVQAIMEELGIPYSIHLIKYTARGDVQAQLGRVDMLIAKAKKEERKSYLLYPKQSYRKATWKFFIRKDDEGTIKFNQLDDLKGLVIGVTKNYAYTEDFWKAGLKLDIETNNSLNLRKLLGSRIDITPQVVINTLYEVALNKDESRITILPKPLAVLPLYNTFVVNSDYPRKLELMDEYDSAVKKLKENGTIRSIIEHHLSKAGIDSLYSSTAFNN